MRATENKYNFDFNIPDILIERDQHSKLNLDLIENKVIVGCMGYTKSGKDSVSQSLVENYGFHRIAFADTLKNHLNTHFREVVYDHILDIAHGNTSGEACLMIGSGAKLADGRILSLDMIDFHTEDKLIKVILRPFMIWLASTLREINGAFYFTNKALDFDAKGHYRLVISDVRRPHELDIFRESNRFNSISTFKAASVGAINFLPQKKIKSYSSFLFHISQFGLSDDDELTHRCIREAQEGWMIDHTFYIDPRLPELGKYRSKSITNQVKDATCKLGIKNEDKLLDYPGKQTSILDYE